MHQGKHIVVIGAGFAGLAAAAFLGKAGYRVTLVDKHDQAGGRARYWEKDGFRFDMGPSWYWMPDVFESFFAQFGKSVSDFYDLKRLDPGYRVFFGEQEGEVDISADLEKIKATFEAIEPGSAKQLATFLKQAEYKYRVGMSEYVHRPSHNIGEFIDFRLIRESFNIQMFRSMSSHVREFFSNPKLIQILEFPVLFLGATPQKIPALYSMMNHADLVLGTWYPMGGMHKIVEGMVAVAEANGVKLQLGTEVQQIVVEGRKATKVLTSQGEIQADLVVAGSDYQHTDQQLLEAPYRNYSPQYWENRVMSPSSLLFYLGINKKLNGLLHHNLFFDEDFGLHAKEIYQTPKWPTKPLFYASLPSQTDPSVAPEGQENMFLLIPLAPGLQDDVAQRERYYNIVMDRLESLTRQPIREHVILKRSYAMNDFEKDYHSFKGNAYGLANTLMQTAFFKPKLKAKKVDNLYFTGQLTVPGPGVPPSLISGEIVAKEVIKHFPVAVV